MLTNEIELPKTMAAVVCHAPEDYRLEELPVPVAGPGEVLVKVESAGICASDLKCYLGAPLFWGDAGRQGYCQPPITPGHEFVGKVVALGDGAGEKYGLEIGDRAVSEQIVPCWNCRFCLTGKYWMCAVHDIYGFRKRTPGAMAEYVRFPVGALNHKVPASMPAHHAVFIEPLACSIHAVQRGNIEFQDTVVIAGAGPLGLGMIAAARMKQPAQLIAVDLNDARLEMAMRCGADIGLNPTKVDVVDEVRKLTDGYGCDVYIEATGHPEGGGRWPAHDPQARHVCRILGDARARDRRLDHHRRFEGTEHPRRPSKSAHLPGGDPDARREPAADRGDRHPTHAARRLPDGNRPGGVGRHLDQGDA